MTRAIYFSIIGLIAVTIGCRTSNNLIDLLDDKGGGNSLNSGIEGTVVRGPMCPVVTDQNPCPDEPFAAMFHMFDEQGKEIGTFNSDEQGLFRVELVPGSYTIISDESAHLLPPRQSHIVEVESNKFTKVTLVFDTGIR